MRVFPGLHHTIRDDLAGLRRHDSIRNRDWHDTLYYAINNQYPESWIEATSEPTLTSVRQATKRLGVEYINSADSALDLYYVWPAVTEDESMDSWLAKVSIRDTKPEDDEDLNYVARRRNHPFFSTIDEVLEAVRTAHPWFILEPGQQAESWRSVITAQTRPNPEYVPESERRFMGDATELNRVREVGYVQAHFDGVWLNDDGNIEERTFSENMYQPYTGYLLDEEQFYIHIRSARANYRSRVMSRIRSARDDAQVEFERKRAEHQAKTQQNFVNFRAKQDEVRGSFGQVMHIPTLPIMPTGTRASRRWGIEIETGAGRDLRGVPESWDSKGDGSLESAYSERQSYTWVSPQNCDYYDRHDIELQTHIEDLENPDTGETREIEVLSTDYRSPADCSYCGWIERDYDDYYDDDDCVELVSPILTSFHSRGLRQICEDLEDAPRTDSAGIHVHVEAKDLTVRNIRDLVLGYDHIEFLLEPSYDRRERGYCKRRAANEVLSIARQARDGVTDPKSLRKGDRYVTVNLQSLDYHGTVEFRAMGPIYNYDHLVRWAMFCREMVNVVKNGATSKDFAKCKTWEDVTKVFARYGVEFNMAAGVSEPATLTADEDALATV